ncbi:MAG TPA: hypothetical protein VGN42_04345 [Pirellulales bacterium]|nr:hypothetical protein [Pirellulales bacterium]
MRPILLVDDPPAGVLATPSRGQFKTRPQRIPAMRADPNYPWEDALLDGYPAAGFVALAAYLLWTFMLSR